jgi:hypothetical protein
MKEKNMKFIVNVDGTQVVLSYEQMHELSKVFANCEKLIDHTVGKDQGTHGYNMGYIHHVRPFNVTEDFKMKMMDDDAYGAAKLVTKLNKEN